MATLPLCSKYIIARREICARSSRRSFATSTPSSSCSVRFDGQGGTGRDRAKQLEFSYKDRNGYHFIDPEKTYDTITLQENLIGDAKDYLVENLSVQVLYAEGKPVEVELPASVNLKVVESAEGLRGDTASNVTKPAKLETGKSINVPLFIKEGETIKIDTRTGAYMGRA